MTQIINLTLERHCIHVSDRKLSRRGPWGGFTSFDKNSNKLVVVAARDALATISYTGLAFLGGRPTDRFLAEVAAGRSLGNDDFMMSAGDGRTISDIGSISLRILDQLSLAWARLPVAEQATSFEVLLSGWKSRGPIMVPFHWEISRMSTVLGWQFRVKRWARMWPSWNRFTLSAAPDVAPGVLESLTMKLREVPAPRVDSACRVLEETMAKIAERKRPANPS